MLFASRFKVGIFYSKWQLRFQIRPISHQNLMVFFDAPISINAAKSNFDASDVRLSKCRLRM